MVMRLRAIYTSLSRLSRQGLTCSDRSINSLFEPYGARIYRQDIQGVRAIGALLIMVYHLWINKVSGGVDVFFVISGFFMASVLLRQAATDATVNPLKFWASIITRIAPAAYCVLLCTVVLAYWLIPETQWIGLVNEVIASALQMQNLHLMRTSVDYLARLEPPSAVQQFWALSIQMQFYFVLPWVFLIGVTASRLARSLGPLIACVILIIAASLTYSYAVTAATPDSAYFNPLARIWQFFVGVLLAILAPHIVLSSTIRGGLAFAGLLLLLTCGLIIPKTVHFPGIIAVVPVAAAACLIIAGTNHQKTRVSRWLEHPWLAFIGGIAFTIYLWHWPLLVFYMQYTGATAVSLAAGITIIALAIILAFTTTKFVEEPLKALFKNPRSLFRHYLFGAACSLPVLAAAGIIKLHFQAVINNQGLAERTFIQGKMPSVQTDASDLSYEQFLLSKTVLPAPYHDDCHQRPADPEVIVCEYGNVHAGTTIALIGGSHATQWLPALQTIGEDLELKILNITKSYCPFGAMENAHESCVEWNQRLVRYLIENPPAAVITNSTRAAQGGRDEYVPDAYVEQWQILANEGIKIIGIRDNPQFEFDAVHCVVRSKTSPLKCSARRTGVLQKKDPAQHLQKEIPTLALIDMTDYLCTSDLCPTVFNNLLIYRDREHLSVSYVNHLTWKLKKQLTRAAPRVFAANKKARQSN